MAFAPDAAWYEAQYGVIGAPGADSVCDYNDNSNGQFPVNPTCFNSGTCEMHIPSFQDPAVYGGGTCECADPSSSGNFANDPAWGFGSYSGEFCAAFTYQMYSTISYIVFVSENDPSSDGFVGIQNKFECSKGSGSGVDEGQSGWETTPDLTTLARLIIGYGGDDAGLATKGYRDYKGSIVATAKDNESQRQHCKICSNSSPCTHPNEPSFTQPATGSYLMVTFASNFNTYYDRACAKPDGSMPLTAAAFTTNPDCQAQVIDKGYEARAEWAAAILGSDSGVGARSMWSTLAEQPTATPVAFPGVTDPEANAFGLDWDSRISIPALYVTYGSAGGISIQALAVPTNSPSMQPSPPPTDEPTSGDCFAAGYTHSPSDLKFVGTADHCRAGLETVWPGGTSDNMCSSPYIICLPAENTPNVGFPMENGQTEYYKSDSHIYTLDECKRECAFDQRCTGFEFWSETGDETGRCSLIDDLPVVMENGDTSTYANEAALLVETDFSVANLGGRICYEKRDYCHPYFGASQLSDAMLNCYCPNNRKGFYTKKVHRTVAATRYCGSDQAIDARIQEAQANRMFHLCENWCLFNTQDPRQESWYHDPWNQCWREQYAGVGTHRSYCYRVIRDPMTIEQHFIDSRSANMCPSNAQDNTITNTPAPVASPWAGSVTWRMAGEGDSCDDVCDDNGEFCDETQTNAGDGDDFASAGYTCTSTATGSEGWALPALYTDGTCLLRHGSTADTGCNLAVGVGYRRLCACYVDASPPG